METEEYRIWRSTVFKRDGHACILCGKSTGKSQLQAHHIHRWTDAPELRLDPDNGVTLCRTCHEGISSREQDFIDRFVLWVRLRLPVELTPKEVEYIRPIYRACLQCGSSYRVERCAAHLRKYCSKSCRNLADRDRPAWNRQNLTAQCVHCGREYPTRPHRLSYTTYCSLECKRNHSSTVRTCIRCGVEYRVKKSKLDSTYCSKQCKDGFPAVILCRQCGCFFLVKATKATTAKFCSRSCYATDRANQMKGKSFETRYKAHL